MATPPATQSKPVSIDHRRIPLVAALVVIASLLPLAALVGWVASGNEADGGDAARALVAYAGVLLAFAAGARYGLAVRVTGLVVNAALVGFAPLIGFVAMLMAPQAALALLAVGLAASGAFDVWSAERSGVPAWYGRLRLLTTPVAVLLVVAGLILVGGD